MQQEKKSGLTVIGLVIAVSVMVILATILIPKSCGLTEKSQQSNDTQVVRQLNYALDTECQNNAEFRPTTMYDAIQITKEYGYDVTKIVTKSSLSIAWDCKNKRFVLLNEDSNSYIFPKDEFNNETGTIEDKINYFVVRRSVADNNGYSVYAGQNFNFDGEVNVSVGFDVGENKDIERVNYTKNGTGQEVVIRTSGGRAILKIEAEGDTVKHYGEAGLLNIVAVAESSYHEYGTVGFAEINKGKIVLEGTCDIKVININKKDETSYDKIIIASNGVKELPYIISRDQVNVTDSNGIRVVEVVDVQANTSEIVKAYPSTDVCNSTEKITTGTSKQNETVTSALGMLVIDSNSNAGEKALDQSAKSDKKDEVAAEANGTSITLDKKYVARIGSVGYETLTNAIGSVTNNQTIVILKNISVSPWVEIKKENVDFAIDVAGKTIDCPTGSLFDIYSKVTFRDTSGDGCYSASGRVFYCNGGADVAFESGNVIGRDGSTVRVGYAPNKAKFVMNGGKINGELGIEVCAGGENGGAEFILNDGIIETTNGYGIFYYNQGNKEDKTFVTINGGLVESSGGNALLGQGNNTKAKITINDGKFISKTEATLYFPGQDNIEINGGYFEGRESMAVKAGAISISSGTFVANGKKSNPTTPDENGYKSTGDCLYVEDNYSNDTSYQFTHDVVINISGGTFESKNAYAIGCRFSCEGQNGAVITVGNGVTLKSANNLTKIVVGNGFVGSIEGVDEEQITNIDE